MSYDLGLKDPVTEKWITLESPHQMRGGTYCLTGQPAAKINITYNYAKHFRRVIPPEENGENGIRALYGKTGAESIPILKKAIAQLGDDVDKDYWSPTEGNAKKALHQCLALAQMCPDGIWDGD
jgi:hypothetical protein